MFSPIIPEPQHLAPPLAVAATERRRDRYETQLPNDAGILAIDLAKRSFQVCAIAPNGEVLFNRKFSRPKLKRFVDERSPSLAAMETCPTAHHWGRVALAAGHDVRLFAPSYVKPFVKRVKNDAADAEAIATAVRQPGMRFVRPKSLDRQSGAVLFKAQQKLVQTRTRLSNSMRSQLSELGLIVHQGCKALLDLLDGLAEDPGYIPETALVGVFALREMIAQCDE